MNTALPTVTSARGIYLYDDQGNDYLDGSSGVLNVNVGHSNPEIIEAIADQLTRLTFVHRSQFGSRQVHELTEALLAIAPRGCGHVEYSNSGSEANECALRLALAYQQRRGNTDRTIVLSEEPSYHGMTAGALSLTGSPSKRDSSVEPLLANGIAGHRVRPAPGRLRAGREEWGEALLRLNTDRIAAVIIEPIGGASSGAAPMDPATLRWLRDQADADGFLLIADEVMSGFGRTGQWWACDHANIAPDLLTSGKGLTGGYTSLAVTYVASKIVEAIGEPIGTIALGHTMSGNPLAAATSLAVLNYLTAHELPARAADLGKCLAERLNKLADTHPAVTGVRGRGLMLGLALAGDPGHPMRMAKRLVAAARDHGLVVCTGGIDSTTESILVAPPLTSTIPDLDELAMRLDAALTTCFGPAQQGNAEAGGLFTESETFRGRQTAGTAELGFSVDGRARLLRAGGG